MGITLDVATAGRLADLDPSLAALPRALQASSPDGPWSLHDVRWSPGRGGRLAYLDSAAEPRFVAVHVDGDGSDTYDWLDDPELPGLAAAADPAEVGRRLESVLGEAVRVTVTPVRYRPRSRGVLRYDIQGASGQSTLFAKVLQPDSYTRVVALHAALAARPVPGLVAEMVVGWPDLHVVVSRSVGGRSASSVLGDAALSSEERAGLGRDLGRLLAQFHGLTVAAASTWTADQQLISLADALGAVECADAAMGIRLGAVLDTLGSTMPPPGDPVFGHGSFRAGQVAVASDGRPVVLDTDEVCHGDRERDLGIALAHLTWQGIRQPHNRPTLARAEQELLAAYQSAASEIRPDALTWWRAAGLVQVAVRRYRRLEVGSWPLVRDLADAAEALVADHRPHAAGDGPLDVEQVATVLAGATDREIRVDSAELLHTAPGRRSVLRYSVRGLDGPEPTAVIGKQFVQARSARLSFYHLRLLSNGPFGDGRFRVPSPVGLVGERRLLFYREDPGARLDAHLDEAGVRRAAGWLAHLHTSELRLPRRHSLTQEVESTKQWADLIAQADPAAAAAASTLASRWADAAHATAVDVEVPIHKDFHAGHVLVGDHTCVIDLDEARMGDPAFDVAHFCTYLDLVGAARPLVDAFLDEYSAASGWVDKGSLAPFCAYTGLKLAKQAVAGSGPFRGVPAARRLASADAALSRGAAWLGTSWQGWS